MLGEYSNPVAKLLTYGECEQKQQRRNWPNYLTLGLTETDIPELIRMVADPQLNRADHDSLKVWAPLHAWRTLGQLKAVDATRPLLKLLDEYEDDDWLPTELPLVMSMIGPSAIPVLEEFMAHDHVSPTNRITIPECFEKIAISYPESRGECVDILIRHLEKYDADRDFLNAFIVNSLVDLDATEAISTIREAYSRKCVDLLVLGDIEDVEILLKLREKRDTPPRRLNPFTGEEDLGLPDEFPHLDELIPTRRHRKVGRNDPCPCGSGKKFKKCCLQ